MTAPHHHPVSSGQRDPHSQLSLQRRIYCFAPKQNRRPPHHVACDSAGHRPIAELGGVDGPLSRLIQEGVQRSSRFQKQPRRLVCMWACRVNEFVKMLSDAYLLTYYFHNV